MKALLINGSPRPHGCTYTALTELKRTLEGEGIEVELIHVGNKDIRGCIACRKCRELGKCVFDDIVNEVAPKLAEADAFVIGAPVYYASPAGGAISFMERLFFSTSAMDKTMKVGGVCQFGKNILDPEQIAKFNADLQAASDIPMFIAVDEEGGRVARLANTDTFDLPKYESAAAVGAEGVDAAYEMGNTIGKYVREYGFNIDFAPDADVNTNPDNPIIGTRAFSSDAVQAAELAKAAGQGIADAGVIPTFKHFPGHGDTAEDSHTGFAYSYRTLEEIQGCELLPFAAASEVSPHAIMVSHISMPNVTGDDTPATLSEKIISLIPDAGNTLIITDALAMQAITDAYSSGEAALKAFQAGCDILFMPYDFAEAYETVLAACKDGTISMERLDRSVDKILSYKAMLN